jgi:hypothetical protein
MSSKLRIDQRSLREWTKSTKAFEADFKDIISRFKLTEEVLKQFTAHYVNPLFEKMNRRS